jgi:hypothetical protein
MKDELFLHCRVMDRIPEAHLAFIGDGPYR